jgi:hypothetical protein
MPKVRTLSAPAGYTLGHPSTGQYTVSFPAGTFNKKTSTTTIGVLLPAHHHWAVRINSDDHELHDVRRRFRGTVGVNRVG